ncbi:MAG: GNAT family N-acetyltransferase [Syntrophales bacterium LBB04]|nr:GNAT family N-acetyltransferase [Syntrophales bacterium LBB04]
MEKGLEQLGFIPYQRLGDSHFETLTIDLSKPLNELLKGLRRDTRWRIKQSEKIGISASVARDETEIEAFYELLLKMSQRKKMIIPQFSFFLNLWEHVLKEHRLGALLMASYNRRLLSGVIILKHGDRAVYTWGASETESLDRVSKNHLVLWKGILWAKEQGCSIFDMGGFAGTSGENPELENIDAYKKGFGGQYCRLIRIHMYIFKKETDKWIRFLFPKR